MAAQHYTIILLPEDKIFCYEFWEDENIDELAALYNTVQLLNFFSNNEFADDILTDNYSEFTLNLDLNQILFNLMSINHISKNFLKPYKMEKPLEDIIEEIVENGCDYGVHIIDFRNVEKIKYSMLLMIDTERNYYYDFVNVDEYVNYFNDYYKMSKFYNDEGLRKIVNKNNNASYMFRNYKTMSKTEVRKLLPKLFTKVKKRLE